MQNLYKIHPKLGFPRLKGVTQKIDINTSSIRVKPIRKVNVVYVIDKQRISISADFRNLEKCKLEKIFLLNEQDPDSFESTPILTEPNWKTQK